jgi:hypothetical protein
MHGDLLLFLQVHHLQTVPMKFPFGVFHPVLLWFRVIVMMRFQSHTQDFLVFPPSLPLPLFALNLPRRLAAIADAFLGMVNIDWLLLVLAYAFLCFPLSFTRGYKIKIANGICIIQSMTFGQSEFVDIFDLPLQG